MFLIYSEQVIVSNKSKTMMGLVTMLKTKNEFEEYTIAQLQAMIHDLAIQEVRGSSNVCFLIT